jgi:hypothetical protein
MVTGWGNHQPNPVVTPSPTPFRLADPRWSYCQKDFHPELEEKMGLGSQRIEPSAICTGFTWIYPKLELLLSNTLLWLPLAPQQVLSKPRPHLLFDLFPAFLTLNNWTQGSTNVEPHYITAVREASNTPCLSQLKIDGTQSPAGPTETETLVAVRRFWWSPSFAPRPHAQPFMLFGHVWSRSGSHCDLHFNFTPKNWKN